MNTSTRTITEGCSIDQFLAALCDGREVFALQPAGHHYHLVRAEHWDDGRFCLGAYRPIEPLKAILFQPREFLGPLFRHDPPESLPERIVVGVKNCDLAGLTIQDHVFGGLCPADPRYTEAREKTIIVTCDCTDCLDVCFCVVVGQKPYAERGFDVNISPLPQQRYLVEAGSQRGERLLDELDRYLDPASDDLLQQRARCRDQMTQRVAQQCDAWGLSESTDLAAAVRGAADSGLWADFAETCVECGACNFACCTCHCFQLADGTVAGHPGRGKQWDGCLLMNFARVAGGGNPRASRGRRLRNRFQKKFDYFPEVLGIYACDGCGRCTEVCAGQIDIRAVLKRAVDETESVHANPGDD